MGVRKTGSLFLKLLSVIGRAVVVLLVLVVLRIPRFSARLDFSDVEHDQSRLGIRRGM